MNKFFDYLEQELSLPAIRELLEYICRFVKVFAGDVPVEGKLGNCRFCASAPSGGSVRVHWVQVGREMIPIDAVV
ncbi:MAG: hypothetical protein KBS74_08345 [Clostridiales bacterium]|nr:hypothetical protein [Candidatus Cacconaster stercorequi]